MTPLRYELVVSNEHPELELDTTWLNTLETLTQLAIAEELESEAEVSLVFTNDVGIRELNREYRDKDSATDVLSFPLYEFASPGEPIEAEEDPDTSFLLGDIVISLDTAVRQANEYGHSLHREVAFLFIHGLLHLVGYDHLQDEERATMRAAEEKYLRKVGLGREES